MFVFTRVLCNCVYVYNKLPLSIHPFTDSKLIVLSCLDFTSSPRRKNKCKNSGHRGDICIMHFFLFCMLAFFTGLLSVFFPFPSCFHYV